MAVQKSIKSVAIIGAGASGIITAAAFHAENYFDRIKLFERKLTAGGTWVYDAEPDPLPIVPGSLPPDSDPPLNIPDGLPRITSPNQQERFDKTPIYNSLTTNVPDIAMSFSDAPFAYGPFVPHHVPRQYLENYVSIHKIDTLLSLNTTVEDISLTSSPKEQERWKLTLRKYDGARHVDIWWSEEFDAVILANGHYAVPFIPEVKGLSEYIKHFPGRVTHSKTYRTPLAFANKKVLLIGNSASGKDLSADLVGSALEPVYQSWRSKSRWDGDEPPEGIAWKPVITEFLPSGRIVFADDTYLDDVDSIIYATGYLPSYPFWNSRKNGRHLWDYKANKLIKTYLHTFFQDFKSLAIVGTPRVLTFRSFEYQAIALARLYSGRNKAELPNLEVQQKWEKEREIERREQGKKFHEIEWETGETEAWLGEFFKIAGLGTLRGEGRIPPVLGGKLRWAIEHLRKYPEPEKGGGDGNMDVDEKELGDGREDEEIPGTEWVVVERQSKKDLLHFI